MEVAAKKQGSKVFDRTRIDKMNKTNKMKIDTKTGWIEGIRHVSSPFFNQRPEKNDISLIVIHEISLPPGEFGGGFVDKLFAGKLDVNAHPYFKTMSDLTVASHFFIDRQGVITQYVSLFDRAWHAGISNFRGQNNCNNYSVGVELEGCDSVPYEEAQYVCLNELIELLTCFFPGITLDRVVGHSDIAPHRKTDPGPKFDWDLVKKE
jgi:N-acetyl-anhydromuramoyl-L-alanine amidase